MTKLINALIGNSIRIFLLIAFALLFTFLVQSWNQLTTPVELSLFSSIQYPLISWITLFFVAGFFCSLLFGYGSKRRLKREIKSLDKKNAEYLNELNKLRNLSLTDDIKSLETINPPKSKHV